MIVLLKTLASGIKAFFLLLFSGVKIVYHILKFLRIRLLAAYLAVCGILQLACSAFTGRMAWFWAGSAICALATVVSWGLYLRNKFRRPLSRTAEGQTESESAEAHAEEPPRAAEETAPPKEREQPAPPQWYGVEGRDDLCFAEYPDRYELYRRTADGGWEFVRTDRKGGTP